MHISRLAGLIALSLATATPVAAQGDADGIKLQIHAVRGNLYMIDDVKGKDSNAGGNVGALVGDDGVVLVDAMVANAGPKIPAILATVTDRPVRFVINTHPHPDHFGGLGVFAPTATIVAHPNYFSAVSVPDSATGKSAAPEAAWPDLLVPNAMTLHRNGEVIDIRHYPRAHTSGDLVVFFRNANAVQLGDTYFAGMFPFVDDGHYDGVVALMEDVLARSNAGTLFIPGHGPMTGRTEYAAMLAMLKDARAGVAEARANGRTVKQLMRDAKLVARLEPWSHGYIGTEAFLSGLYAAAERI